MPFQDWRVHQALTQIRRSYLRAGQRVELFPHYLQVTFGLVGVGALVAAPPLVIPKEATFIWLGNSVRPHGEQSDQGGVFTGVELAGFNLRISILPSTRYISRGHRDQAGGPDGFVPILNIAGRGRMPFLWPWPIVLGGASTLVFELANRGDAAQTVTLTLIGAKLYHYMGGEAA